MLDSPREPGPSGGPGSRGVRTELAATRNFGRAWLALTVALAVHVMDEAMSGFVAFYNPTVEAFHGRVPWLPAPQFTFGAWLAGLAAAILLLLLLSRFAFANARVLRPFAYVFGVLMIGNGLVHLAASVWLGRLAPGALSSPLLLAAGAYLLTSLARSRRRAPARALART